jgi:HK97 family phage major capsid protein
MDSEEGKKKTLTKDELKDMIRDVVQDQVVEALEPLKKQQTNWMDQIQQAATAAEKQKVRDTASPNKGIGAARFVRALAFGQGDLEKAKFFAKKAWNDDLGDKIADKLDFNKVMQAGDFTAGGFMIPEDFIPEIIELLRAFSIVRAANPRILPMPTGSLTIRKQTATAGTSYVGESVAITSTEPAGGQIRLTAKKLAAIVPVSNELLSFTSGPNADEFIRDDLVASIATREDQAFLRDNGLSETPKGIRNWALAANILTSAGTTATNIETDFKVLINALENNDVRLLRPVWFMHPRSKNHLFNLRDANGNLIFPEIRGPSPMLYGWPVFVSTNIPRNLGAGTETEVYFVDMIDAIIGEASTLEIQVDSSASYLDGSTLVSAFARDETLVRAISRHDFAMRHEESVALISNVTWGA